MTEREMRRLSRAELLEMLIDQSTELQQLREKLGQVEAALEQRELAINTAGSIAEAALQLNGVFEAAQASAQQYMDNIRLLSDRQEAVCAQMEEESRERAERMVSEAEQEKARLEEETKVQCAEMQSKARAECDSYWNEMTTRLEAFYSEHAGLQEMLSLIPTKHQ